MGVKYAELFTPEMIEAAKKCKDTTEIMEKVILPNMGRINKFLDQENDPKYVAYMLEHTLNQLAGK